MGFWVLVKYAVSILDFSSRFSVLVSIQLVIMVNFGFSKYPVSKFLPNGFSNRFSYQFFLQITFKKS